MIELIRKVIAETVPNLSEDDVRTLSFLKYSTSSSGKNLDDKVILFAFKKNAPEPFVCIKTVRNYKSKEVIARSFDNLKKLNTLVEESGYEPMFPRALYLHDDGEQIFSIETVCSGRRMKLDSASLDKVVMSYSDFQEYVAQKGDKELRNVEEIVNELLVAAHLTQDDEQLVRKFIATLSLSQVMLPRVIQHGDVTEDNILIEKKGVCIVDCDFAGFLDLPGFDLFGLLYRWSPGKAKELCAIYLPQYFSRIGAKVSDYRGLFFLYYFAERAIRKSYLSKQISVEEIISGFKKHFS